MVAATSRMKQADSAAASSAERGGDSRVFDWPACGVLQTMATATVLTAISRTCCHLGRSWRGGRTVVLSPKSPIRRSEMSAKKLKLTGSFVALITPFNKDGSVDFEAFRALLKFQADHGSSAILIMGSTGETSMLSPEEKKKIIVETAKMKTAAMPIFFGCTGNNTEATIANVKFAKDNGADGAILAAPSYICAPESDIECFFLEIADATDLPLGIYNNPPRVKTDLNWDQLLRIFKHPNYVVHKESTGRVGQVAQVLAGKPSVSVMCCDSPNLGLVVPTMSLGGHGTANMTGNVAPAEL